MRNLRAGLVAMEMDGMGTMDRLLLGQKKNNDAAGSFRRASARVCDSVFVFNTLCLA